MTDPRPHSQHDLERAVRALGLLLLVSALVCSYASDLIDNLDAGTRAWLATLGFTLLAPSGATLVAVSISIRAVAGGATAALTRYQAMAGIAFLVVGLGYRSYGSQIVSELTAFLGPTGQAGIFVVTAIARTVSTVSLPLAVALLCTLPLTRLGRSQSVN